MEYSVRITGDINDCDIEAVEFDMEENSETHKMLLKFITFLKQTKKHDYETHRENYEAFFTEEELEGYILSFIPRDYEYDYYAHTILEIKMSPKIKWEVLY